MEEFGDPYSLIALVQATLGQYDEAVVSAERALELSPGGADVQSFVALALFFSGDFKGGIKHMLEGMRLEPDYPEWVPGQLYPMLFEDGQFNETIALATDVLGRQMRDIRAHPQAGWAHILAHALKGDLEKARPFVQNALKTNPNLKIKLTMASTIHVAPRQFHDQMRKAFLAAGVPPAAD